MHQRFGRFPLFPCLLAGAAFYTFACTSEPATPWMGDDGQPSTSNTTGGDPCPVIDCADPACANVSACSEPNAENNDLSCEDDIDNDGDNAVDCDDPDCAATAPCAPPVEICDDLVDNDGDNAADCDDPDCVNAPACEDIPTEDCTDGSDNNGDDAVDCQDLQCASLSLCDDTLLRVVSYNIKSVGTPGDDTYNSLRAVLQRISPDVACLQEVEGDESSALNQLARDLGYPHIINGDITTAMSGDLSNACLSRFPFDTSGTDSKSSDDISTDRDANETGRDIVQVRVEVIPDQVFVGIINLHLKSGLQRSDRFRRTIESYRAQQVAQTYSQRFPDDPLLVLGDFNAEIDDDDLSDIFSSPPSGLPVSFELGADISLPITYNPFQRFLDLNMTVVDATHEDTTANYATRIPSGRRIDYIFARGAEITGDEVYDACADNNLDDPPAGQHLPKYGASPGCGVNQLASDHRAIIVELRLVP